MGGALLLLVVRTHTHTKKGVVCVCVCVDVDVDVDVDVCVVTCIFLRALMVGMTSLGSISFSRFSAHTHTHKRERERERERLVAQLHPSIWAYLPFCCFIIMRSSFRLPGFLLHTHRHTDRHTHIKRATLEPPVCVSATLARGTSS